MKLSSKELEEFAQTLTSNRTLTTDEEKQLKKQRRLIKNRESAQLSRLRKKFYIEELEKKVAQINQENETLTKQLMASNGDKKKLQEEVTYLRSLLAQYQHVPTPQYLSSEQVLCTSLQTEGVDEMGFPASSQTSSFFPSTSGLPIASINSGHRNVKTASVCLLVLLFSFGLLFNTQQGPVNSDSGLVPSLASLQSSAKLNGGRHLLEDLPSTPLRALPDHSSSYVAKKIDKASAVSIEDSLKNDNNTPLIAVDEPATAPDRNSGTVPNSKRQKVRIDDSKTENRVMVRKGSDEAVTASSYRHVTNSLLSLPNSTHPTQIEASEWHPKDNTAYLYCPQQPQVVFHANSENSNAKSRGIHNNNKTSQNSNHESQVPENIALLIPSSILTGDSSQIDPSMLEVNCQVLSYYSWPIVAPSNHP